MNIRSVSTMGMSLQGRQSIGDNQKQLLVLLQEQATGKHYDVAGELGALSSRAIRLRESFNSAQAYLTNNQTLASRIEVTQNALTNVTSSGNDFITKIVAALNGDTARNLMPNAAADLIANLESALNTSFGGRSVFAGTDVDRQALQNSGTVNPNSGFSPLQVIQNVIASKPPVTDAATLDDLLNGPDGIASIFDNSNTNAAYRYNSTFFNGNSQDVTAKIDDTTVVAGGARADEDGIKLIMKAAYTLAAIDPQSMPDVQYRELLNAALSDIQKGMAQTQQKQALLGLSQQSIDAVNQRHSLMSDMASRQINALEQVDPYETAVRLSNMTTQIESTFSITARINKLSLINYL